MASNEMRFSLNERTPGAIKSQGGVSGTSVTVQDATSVQSILDTIHNTKVENHEGNTDWYVDSHHFSRGRARCIATGGCFSACHALDFFQTPTPRFYSLLDHFFTEFPVESTLDHLF